MKKIIGIVGFFLAAILATSAVAQPAEPYERRRFSQMELDQMLAPIALYPDALLSQILMAATYPRDLSEAASWARAHRISGQEAVRAVEREPWDPSVISLAAFPHVLEMMDERREWTDRLGEAFLAQPQQVMQTVQELRRRAYEAGHLRSTSELYVERSGRDFVIESPAEEVYVPYYDPRVVYGRWWWPGYDPVWWSPWSGYAHNPGWGFGWGPSIYVGSGFFFGGFDWRHRHVRYSHHRPWYWRHHHHDYRHGHRWTHSRDHRWRDRDGDGRAYRHQGRWRDRDGDGRHDGPRDGRWRDRDGEGRRGHDGRGGRGGGGHAPSGGVLQGAAQAHGGLVAPVQAAPRSQALTPVAPSYRERAVREQPLSGAGRAPELRSFSAPRTVHVPSAPAAPVQQLAPLPQRHAPAPQYHAPAPQQHHAPAPPQRLAPAPQRMERAERPAPQPVERAERPAPSEPRSGLSGAGRFRER